jgi:hypothetical protein
MPYNFCTLFDKNYLYKGLALYNSLKRNCENFKLFILCMDDVTYNLLHKMALENVELISLKEFEDPELLRIKNTRTWAEYCWTCTASLLSFLLKKYPSLDTITYLDADLYFYSNPTPIFEEFNGDYIFITEHNSSQEFRRLLIYGKYNVQFIIFRNNNEGLKALEWWREKTINRCYSRRFGKNMQGGDQIYLNDWSTRFKGVHVLQNKKLCLAPWNANKYHLALKDNNVYVDDTKLVLYHFHSFEINGLNRFTLADGAYKITNITKRLIYYPYINEIKAVMKYIQQIEPDFKYGIIRRSCKKKCTSFIKKNLYNLYRLKLNLKIK